MKKYSSFHATPLLLIVLLVGVFVAISISVYRPGRLDVRSQAQSAMTTQEFRSLLSSSGIQLPSPLPETLSPAQFAQVATLTRLTTADVERLYREMLEEERVDSQQIDVTAPVGQPLLTQALDLEQVPATPQAEYTAQLPAATPQGTESTQITPSAEVPVLDTSLTDPETQAVGVPIPVSPANGAIVYKIDSNSPSVSWRNGTGDRALVLVSRGTGTAFDENIIANIDTESPTPNGTATIPSHYLSPGLTYYWKVLTYWAEGGPDYGYGPSATWSFKTAYDRKPVLGSPIGGELVGIRPMLSWTSLPNAARYSIQISTVPAFTTLVHSATVTPPIDAFLTMTYFVPVDLPDGRPIYWRVLGTSSTGMGNSPWSEVGTFTTKDFSTVPILKTPTSGSLVQTTTPTFTWNPSTSPTPANYELQVASQGGSTFDGSIVHHAKNLSGSLTSYTYTPNPTKLTAGSAYYWRVRSVTADGNVSSWSTIWTVKIAPQIPTLLTPTNGATDVKSATPKLDWADAQGATNYFVQVSRNSTFTSLVVNKLVGSAISELTTPVLAENVTHYWRVYSVSSVGNSTYSPVFSFVSADAPTAPTTYEPVNGSSIDEPVVIRWNYSISPYAKQYLIQVSTSAGALFDSAIIHTETELEPSSLIPGEKTEQGQKYYWRVRGISDKGVESQWSSIASFGVKPTVPTLLLPADGQTYDTASVNLDWQDSVGATNYFLQISKNATFTSLVYNSAIGTATSAFTTPVLTKNTTYFWRVYAMSPGGNSAYSSARSFTVPNTPPVPVQLSPTNGILQASTTPTLTWRATVPPAESYQVEVSTKGGTDFGSGIIQTEAVHAPSTSYTTKTLPAGAVYYWRVRALSELGTVSSGWSAIWSVKVAPSVPTLLSPAQGATNLKNLNPTFDWSDVSRATNYFIQVSRNNTFTSLVVNQLIGSTMSQFTPTTPLPNNSLLYWRVYAVSAAGNSTYSAPWSFSTPKVFAAPPITGPTNGSVQASLYLKWAAPAGILGYENAHVQISTTAGADFSSGIIYDKQDFNASLGWYGYGYQPSPMIPGNSTYYWRVRIIDTNGVQGYWSPILSFKLIPDPPALLSPADKAKLTNPRPTLKWAPMTGLTSYRVQIARDVFFGYMLYNIVVPATGATEFTVPTDLPIATYKQYYWRVQAISPIGSSEFLTQREFSY